MIQYTEITDTSRSSFGVQVIVTHGFYPYREAKGLNTQSPNRARAQGLWARQRLIERGDSTARNLEVTDVRSREIETQVSLVATPENSHVA